NHYKHTQQYQQYIQQHGGGSEQCNHNSHDSSLGLESQFASSLPTGRLTLFSASVRSRFSACSFTMSFDALMSASVFFRLSSRSLWIVSACASMRLVQCPLHFVL